MRWAILGGKLECLRFARMLSAVPDFEPVLLEATEWESLLARDDCDAVVVELGLDETLRAEQLKKLIAERIPVIAVHPAVDVLTAYELEVIRRDLGGPLVPFAPGWHHPVWNQLQELLLSNDEGNPSADLVTFTRYISNRRPDRVHEQLSQDLHILRRLIGAISSVTGTGVAACDHSWNSLTVQLVGETGRSAIWTLALPDAAPESQVTISGGTASTTLKLTGPLDQEPWILHDRNGRRDVFPPVRDAQNLIEQLNAAIRGDQTSPTWYDACLDLEISDAVSKSLRRKRTIDLHTSERSEEQTFKSFMSVAGCLMLVAVLLVILGLALWDGFRGPFREPTVDVVNQSGEPGAAGGDRWPLWVRLWPVYPVAAFLSLQLLLLIARRSTKESSGN